MKMNSTARLAAILVAVIPIAFSACVKDKCTRAYTYSWLEPIYKTKDQVRANIRSNAPRELQNTGKFYLYGNYIFLNEIDKGIHIIDNSNPQAPRNTGFIDIPGNLDIAVKGNTLYADLYTDLVAIDISNPSAVAVKKVVENLFPHRAYGYYFQQDSARVIVDWRRVDTTVYGSCGGGGRMDFGDPRRDVLLFSAASGAQNSGSLTSGAVGISGSMARFTIRNDRMYTVNTSSLDVFNISNTADPVHTNRVNVGWEIETIFPFKDKLFIGSRTGMYIYNVVNPDAPTAAGQFQHVRTCDPVIADDDYAYVTLSSGSTCMGFTNELDILKLNNFTNPQLLKVYPMTNPKGLSKSGSHLFICDGSAGLKIFDASDVMNLRHIKTIDNIDAYDVVTYNNIALVVAKGGLYQYNYSDINNVRLLSKITVKD